MGESGAWISKMSLNHDSFPPEKSLDLDANLNKDEKIVRG